MRIAYLDCFSGISGDMLLGAMIDAGVPLERLSKTVASLNVGAHLHARKVVRAGIAATKLDVHTAESAHTHESNDHSHGESHSHAHDAHDHEHRHEHDHAHGHSQEHDHGHEAAHSHEHHRSLSTILKIIAAAPLPERVKQRSAQAFQLLGEAEAAIHSIDVEKVHFHEVGAVDTIVDIVCAAAGAEILGIDRWIASPLNVGSGTVNCAHGTLPVPAPATLSLLADAPIYAAGPAMERVTPTGAAVLRMLDVEYDTLPALRTQRTGYGAGGRDTPGQPNVLRLLVGEDQKSSPTSEPIAILETVIDDATPQLLAYVSELLLESGAWDVYRVPVQMKKGRSGVQLTVLCSPDHLEQLREIVFRETTTIGAHWRIEQKMALRREFSQVQTQWGPVSIKVAHAASGQIRNAAPEFEDCRRIAIENSVPLKFVMQEAMRLFAATNPIPRESADGTVQS